MEKNLIDIIAKSGIVGAGGQLAVILEGAQILEFVRRHDGRKRGLDFLDDLRQQRTLAAQFLGVRRVVPDCRIFKLAIDFGQTLMLLIVVKDTPE